MIPTRLHPIDNPINRPLLNLSKLLVSFLVKTVNAKYNRFPKTIKNVPIFNFFMKRLTFYFKFKYLLRFMLLQNPYFIRPLRHSTVTHST